MGKKEEKTKEYPLFKAARRILLAGVGAAALAQDEIEDFVAKLVERGEIAEKDGKKLLKEIMEKRKGDAATFEGRVSSKVEELLKHMNIPTREDIDRLNEKLASLEQKLGEPPKKPE